MDVQIANEFLVKGFKLIAQKYFTKPLNHATLLSNPTNLSVRKWKREESIFGESDEMYIVNDDYYALFYAFLMYQSHVLYKKSWADIKVEFDYEVVKKCFLCKGIKIDDFLTIFGIPTPTNCGIEHIAIEYTFQIENGLDCGAVVAKYVPKGKSGYEALLNLDECLWSINDCRCLTTFRPSNPFPRFNASSSSSNACTCGITAWFYPTPPSIENLFTVDGSNWVFNSTVQIPDTNRDASEYFGLCQISKLETNGTSSVITARIVGDPLSIPAISGTYLLTFLYSADAGFHELLGAINLFVEITDGVSGGAITKYFYISGEKAVHPCIHVTSIYTAHSEGINESEIDSNSNGSLTPIVDGNVDAIWTHNEPGGLLDIVLPVNANYFYTFITHRSSFGWDEVDSQTGELVNLSYVSSVVHDCENQNSGSGCGCEITNYVFIRDWNDIVDNSSSTSLHITTIGLDDLVVDADRFPTPISDGMRIIVYEGDSGSVSIISDVVVTTGADYTITTVAGRTYMVAVELVMQPFDIKSRAILKAYIAGNKDFELSSSSKFSLNNQICLGSNYQYQGTQINANYIGFYLNIRDTANPLVEDTTIPINITFPVLNDFSRDFVAGTFIQNIVGWDDLADILEQYKVNDNFLGVPAMGSIRTNCEITHNDINSFVLSGSSEDCDADSHSFSWFASGFTYPDSVDFWIDWGSGFELIQAINLTGDGTYTINVNMDNHLSGTYNYKVTKTNDDSSVTIVDSGTFEIECPDNLYTMTSAVLDTEDSPPIFSVPVIITNHTNDHGGHPELPPSNPVYTIYNLTDNVIHATGDYAAILLGGRNYKFYATGHAANKEYLMILSSGGNIGTISTCSILYKFNSLGRISAWNYFGLILGAGGANNLQVAVDISHKTSGITTFTMDEAKISEISIAPTAFMNYLPGGANLGGTSGTKLYNSYDAIVAFVDMPSLSIDFPIFALNQPKVQLQAKAEFVIQ